MGSKVFQIAVKEQVEHFPQWGEGKGNMKILCGVWGGFFTGWWEPEEEWFWPFEPFSKLKTAFCEY